MFTDLICKNLQVYVKPCFYRSKSSEGVKGVSEVGNNIKEWTGSGREKRNNRLIEAELSPRRR